MGDEYQRETRAMNDEGGWVSELISCTARVCTTERIFSVTILKSTEWIVDNTRRSCLDYRWNKRTVISFKSSTTLSVKGELVFVEICLVWILHIAHSIWALFVIFWCCCFSAECESFQWAPSRVTSPRGVKAGRSQATARAEQEGFL